MSLLLDMPPYSVRDDTLFLQDINALTAHHLNGCQEYARLFAGRHIARTVEEVPYLHVGLFKHIKLMANLPHLRHERTLLSSATTADQPSRIILDEHSSALQTKSASAILRDFLGDGVRPLMILDSVKSLRRRGEISARIAAAMSLRPLSVDTFFLLQDAEDVTSVKWKLIVDVAEQYESLLVYGFTWVLWMALGNARWPLEVEEALARKTVQFIHSGGWKKLENLRVDRETFEKTLLRKVNSHSTIVDFYGLIEQVGVPYPLCEYGFRHVPVWADVLIRDPFTLDTLVSDTGQIQLLNVLSYGAPYHSVLTEDLGVIVPGPCKCGRSGKKFELRGRVPKAQNSRVCQCLTISAISTVR